MPSVSMSYLSLLCEAAFGLSLSKDSQGKFNEVVWPGTEEFYEVTRPGRKSFLRYLGRDGRVF